MHGLASFFLPSASLINTGQENRGDMEEEGSAKDPESDVTTTGDTLSDDEDFGRY